MTDGDNDVEQVSTWSQKLTAIDVDDAGAERIQQRARLAVGRGRSPVRFVLPVLAAVGTASYLVWALLRAADIFR